MATATQLLNAVRAEVGYREGSDNFNRYGAWYGMNRVPYCAIGLTYAAFRVNGAAAIGGRWAYCPWWAAWFRSRGRWSDTPARGRIVFFDWTGEQRKGSEMHVAIVESVSGDYINTIEFNTEPGVGHGGEGVYKRKRHRRLVVGYGLPYYTEEIKVVPIITIPPGSKPTHVILAVDGIWGRMTTSRVQEVLRVSVTGKMDRVTYRALAVWLGQPPHNGWTEPMKTALQYRVGVQQDGEIGPITVRAFQRFLNRLPGKDDV